MQNPIAHLFCLAVFLTPSARAQIEPVLSVPPPPLLPAWGASGEVFSDVDGDGIAELLIGAPHFGGGVAGTVHSGATGALLFSLLVQAGPMFFGDAVFAVQDENHDGVDEIMCLGSQSGASGSAPGALHVFSGADGSPLRQLPIGAGASFQAHSLFDAYSPGDLDGDGFGDVLAPTVGFQTSGGPLPLTALSGRTGEVLYVAAHGPTTLTAARSFVAISDHDGDGLDDVAIAIRQPSGGAIEIRSTATGLVLAHLPTQAASHLTGNHEPFLSITDADGDGLRDLAIGGFFDGYAAIVSSATGALLQEWPTGPDTLFGSRIIEVSDFSGDGHPDLISVQAFGDFGAEQRLFGLDPLSGDVVLDQAVPGLPMGYTGEERLIALGSPATGLDPLGFPSFAVMQDSPRAFTIMRVLPSVGTHDCDGEPGPSGTSALLTARGARSLSGPTRFTLTIADAQPHGFSAILFGTERDIYTIGPAELCIGTSPGLIRLGMLSGSGGKAADVDLSALGAVAMQNWTFQGVFRDAQWGVRATNAVTITVAP